MLSVKLLLIVGIFKNKLNSYQQDFDFKGPKCCELYLCDKNRNKSSVMCWESNKRPKIILVQIYVMLYTLLLQRKAVTFTLIFLS